MSVPDAADETGAVLAFVALGLVVFMGCAAIAIDLGNVWAHRRSVTTAADAAALAAAQEYATGGTGCSATAKSYVKGNLHDATLASCQHATTAAGTGQVEVGARVGIDHWFAPLIGIGSSTVEASTTAFYGSASSADGVRPVGLCAASPAYQAWSGTVPSGEIFVPFEVPEPSVCGTSSTAGALALLGVPCGTGSGAATKGFPQRITPPQPACIEADGIAQIAATVDAIRAADEPVVIPVYELVGE
ncbi:MAG: pilus assembly protein TadG-related protein, partial [Actinomycetota bacterium]